MRSHRAAVRSGQRVPPAPKFEEFLSRAHRRPSGLPSEDDDLDSPFGSSLGSPVIMPRNSGPGTPIEGTRSHPISTPIPTSNALLTATQELSSSFLASSTLTTVSLTQSQRLRRAQRQHSRFPEPRGNLQDNPIAEGDQEVPFMDLTNPQPEFPVYDSEEEDPLEAFRVPSINPDDTILGGRFNQALDSQVQEYCPRCKERWFSIGI